MNRFNKNIVHRTICIFLLLTLCMGLCFAQATTLPVTMVEGRYYGLDEGYSIRVVNINLEEERAWFELYKKGIRVDRVVGHEVGSFNLDDGEIFHFDASVYRFAENAVELSGCNCRGLCFEEYVSGEGDKKTLVPGNNWELPRGYSIRAVTVDLEGDKAGSIADFRGQKVVLHVFASW